MTVPFEVGAEDASAAPEAVLVGAGKIEGRSLGQIAWMRLKRDKVALAGLAVLVFLTLVAIFAPLIVRAFGQDPNQFNQDLIDTAGGTLTPIGPYGGMSWDHLMGIEPVNGRDIFSRVVYGARISLLIAILATLVSVVIGSTLGIIAGFFGGRVDAFISRLMDIFLAFPLLVFAIALAGVVPDQAFGLEGNQLRVALAGLHHRLLQLALHRSDHPRPDAVAARAGVRRGGAQSGRPPALHPGPGDPAQPDRADPGLLDAADPDQHLVRGGAVLPRASASARRPPRGAGCSPRRSTFYTQPHFMLWPGLAIFVTVLAFNLFGDGLRDALDPRANR